MTEYKWELTCPACGIKGKFHDINEFAKIIGDKQALLSCSSCGTYGIFELKMIHGLDLPHDWDVKDLPKYMRRFNEEVAPKLFSSDTNTSNPYPLSSFQFDLSTYTTGEEILICALLDVFCDTTPLDHSILFPFTFGLIGPGTPDVEADILFFIPSTAVGAFVKTRLMPAIKDRLERICKERGISISEGVRRAIVEWIRAN